MRIKKFTAVFILTALMPACAVNAAQPPSVDAAAAILAEASTGTVLMEENADTPLPPASVTKVMTLLLIYDSEAQGKIKWDDVVTVSEHAASMGGSQIFLEAGEKQTAATLTKAVAIASANDAAVAMAEYIAGSESAFVEMMNERAKGLGMKNTVFKNACGLDTEGHEMSARDISLMSRELITKYPQITEYTTKWQDMITHKTAKGESEFGLTNTNRLIKWYDGATGLKTGSTGNAKYCLSGTAKRDGMELVAVVMGCPEPKLRFKEVMKLLDYGYANYMLLKGEPAGKIVSSVPVLGGTEDSVNAAVAENVSYLAQKGSKKLEYKTDLPENIKAPINAGDELGVITYTCDGEEVGSSKLIAEKTVEKCGFGKNLKEVIKLWFIG
ncbi:MAG: D-alanyl-D-alanine carboxypeptidase [Firmicutes bacterium]|nr:D-alanyl-D-alanine carboxypeptidase [Bacillota bacterium]